MGIRHALKGKGKSKRSAKGKSRNSRGTYKQIQKNRGKIHQGSRRDKTPEKETDLQKKKGDIKKESKCFQDPVKENAIDPFAINFTTGKKNQGTKRR